MNQKIIEETEKIINTILEEGIQNGSNLEYLDKLVDIRKDVKEDEQMRYFGYGNYSEYGRGGYGEYGRRGRDSRGRYTGNKPEDKIDEMYMNYQGYSEGREQYGRSGNYGAKEDSMKCLEFMLESMVDFAKMLKQDASSPEEQQIIQQYFRQIGEM